MEQEKVFPNGFKNWAETHHVIVEQVSLMIDKDEDSWAPKVYHAQADGGTGGVWRLCEDLTDKFEQEHKGVEWDGEWFDAIEKFLTKELG